MDVGKSAQYDQPQPPPTKNILTSSPPLTERPTGPRAPRPVLSSSRGQRSIRPSTKCGSISDHRSPKPLQSCGYSSISHNKAIQDADATQHDQRPNTMTDSCADPPEVVSASVSVAKSNEHIITQPKRWPKGLPPSASPSSTEEGAAYSLGSPGQRLQQKSSALPPVDYIMRLPFIIDNWLHNDDKYSHFIDPTKKASYYFTSSSTSSQQQSRIALPHHMAWYTFRQTRVLPVLYKLVHINNNEKKNSAADGQGGIASDCNVTALTDYCYSHEMKRLHEEFCMLVAGQIEAFIADGGCNLFSSSSSAVATVESVVAATECNHREARSYVWCSSAHGSNHEVSIPESITGDDAEKSQYKIGGGRGLTLWTDIFEFDVFVNVFIKDLVLKVIQNQNSLRSANTHDDSSTSHRTTTTDHHTVRNNHVVTEDSVEDVEDLAVQPLTTASRQQEPERTQPANRKRSIFDSFIPSLSHATAVPSSSVASSVSDATPCQAMPACCAALLQYIREREEGCELEYRRRAILTPLLLRWHALVSLYPFPSSTSSNNLFTETIKKCAFDAFAAAKESSTQTPKKINLAFSGVEKEETGSRLCNAGVAQQRTQSLRVVGVLPSQLKQMAHIALQMGSLLVTNGHNHAVLKRRNSAATSDIRESTHDDNSQQLNSYNNVIKNIRHRLEAIGASTDYSASSTSESSESLNNVTAATPNPMPLDFSGTACVPRLIELAGEYVIVMSSRWAPPVWDRFLRHLIHHINISNNEHRQHNQTTAPIHQQPVIPVDDETAMTTALWERLINIYELLLGYFINHNNRKKQDKTSVSKHSKRNHQWFDQIPLSKFIKLIQMAKGIRKGETSAVAASAMATMNVFLPALPQRHSTKIIYKWRCVLEQRRKERAVDGSASRSSAEGEMGHSINRNSQDRAGGDCAQNTCDSVESIGGVAPLAALNATSSKQKRPGSQQQKQRQQMQALQDEIYLNLSEVFEILLDVLVGAKMHQQKHLRNEKMQEQVLENIFFARLFDSLKAVESSMITKLT